MSTPELILSRALSRASFEVSPPQAISLKHSLARVLTPRTNVFVTSLARGARSDTLIACRAIADAGSKPIPHIAARSFASWDDLDSFLKSIAEIEIAKPTSDGPAAAAAAARHVGGHLGTSLLGRRTMNVDAAAADGNFERSRGGVDQVMLIGGDLTPPAGPIQDTLQVLDSGLLQRHGFRRVGFAGYPEGCHNISDSKLERALEQKNEWVASTDGAVEGFLVSQFCFDSEHLTAWFGRLSSLGNTLPVQVGVAGPTSLPNLLRFAQWAGVGTTASMLTRNPMQALKIATSVSPEPLLLELMPYMSTEDEIQTEHETRTKVEGIHLYTFGGFVSTVEWARERSTTLQGTHG